MPSSDRTVHTKPFPEAPDLNDLVATTAARVADSALAVLRSMFSEQAIRGVIEREAKIAVQGALLAELRRMRAAPQTSPAPALQHDVQPPLAYRINDAAQAIGVGRTKLHTLIAEGKIIARKRDGLTFIRAVDLNAYLLGVEEADAKDVANEDQESIQ